MIHVGTVTPGILQATRADTVPDKLVRSKGVLQAYHRYNQAILVLGKWLQLVSECNCSNVCNVKQTYKLLTSIVN
jgi:hypothetical protein